MPASSLTITIHMVSSLDGFIAKRNNSIDWFDTNDQYEQGIESGDTAAFLKSIDCYVMGSRTYQLATELSGKYGWPYGDKPVIVLTRRILTADQPTVTFFKGDLQQLVSHLHTMSYQHAWVVGGAALTKSFIQEKLVDEIRMTILPIILGDGLLFFDKINEERSLHLKEAKAYKNGMVELCYAIKK